MYAQHVWCRFPNTGRGTAGTVCNYIKFQIPSHVDISSVTQNKPMNNHLEFLTDISWDTEYTFLYGLLLIGVKVSLQINER